MKIRTGKVVSTKNQKTAVVVVERFFAHPMYEKRVRRTKRYPVHNEIGAKEGDVVRFSETRPISKTKRWKILEVAGAKKLEAREKPKKTKQSLPLRGKTSLSLRGKPRKTKGKK